MRTMGAVLFGLLLVTLAGCASGRRASAYDHPVKQTIAERWNDFAMCRITTGTGYGEHFDRCLAAKGYSPVYAD